MVRHNGRVVHIGNHQRNKLHTSGITRGGVYPDRSEDVELMLPYNVKGYLNTARYAFDEDTDEEEEEEDLETPAGLRPPPNRFAHIKGTASSTERDQLQSQSTDTCCKEVHQRAAGAKAPLPAPSKSKLVQAQAGC